MGYEKKVDGLKFYKGLLCPQWKFLVHTILYCLSPKTSGWNEFSTTEESAMICLSKGQPCNFSKLVLDGLKKNLKGNVYVYPRFLQLIIDKQLSNDKVHRRTYVAPVLQKKMFSYLKKNGKDFSRTVTPLFPYMLSLVQNQGEGAAIPTATQHTPTLWNLHPHNHKRPKTLGMPKLRTLSYLRLVLGWMYQMRLS